MTSHRRNGSQSLASVSAFIALLSGCGADDAGASGGLGTIAISQLVCNTVVDQLVFSYEAIVFSSGDTLVDCSVSNLYTEGSDTNYYLAGQTGTETGYCGAGLDSSGPASAGFWEFAFSGDLASVTYRDVGDANNGSVLTFLASECNYTEL